MNNLIKALEWRYATKKFDSTQKVSDDELEVLKKALQLSPSSFGLQAYTYIIVESPDLREQLSEAAYRQQQVKDASHLVVFAVYDHLKEQHVDEYMANIANTRSMELSALDGFSNGIKNSSLKLSKEQQHDWMAKQTYISLGILLQTAASLNIDATPMEGFNATRVDEILDLKSKNLRTVLMCPIGYRHEDDAAQHYQKVRKPMEQIFLAM